MTGNSWRITLLNGLRLERDAQSITRFKYQKVGGLLAYLAYHRRQMHTREVLVETFWPESSPEAGRANLSVALSSLRHQLEPPGTPAGSVLRADRYSVGLNPAAVTTDVAEFEAALQASARASSATERAQFLTQAVALYVGPLLPGHYEEWITGEQERLSGLFFDAAGRLISDLEAAGDLNAALRHARYAVGVDRLREDGQQHLIRLLAALGQPGAALRQYREFERVLDEEMAEEPSAPLRALARRIEQQSGLSVPAVPSPPPVSRPEPARRDAPSLRSGTETVTFLLTDIEGSTRLWERAGDAFKPALETHHRALRRAFDAHGGREITEAGDAFIVAFPSARNALACAADAQQALADADWPETTGPLPVRMAVHTGDVEFKDGEYHGLVLHRASRMLTAAHGGQILVSEATAGLLRRDLEENVRLIDLGIYRLRDVPTPERLFQAEHPGSSAQTPFPPLSAEAGHAAHLPLQFTRFFGREREIEQITEMLRGAPDARLVTLTGPGGTGKTRLALQVVEGLVGHFAGAVTFTPLADLSDPNLIAGAILDSLRVPRSPQREPLEQVVEALNKQPSLLVLDNFEHLVEGGASVVQAMLGRVPGLTLLVTSRQLLGLSGEREFALKPLPTPHGPDTPEGLSAFDSVRLFVDRAQAARPDFQVTNQNAPAVAELCDRLEGIPLALELAAARALVLTPSQMLAQLAHRFEFLASRKRDASERQRTLRGAVDWSYRLLSPELQRFFARLSVFRGGWTAEAAEQVGEEPLALDYLAQLRECSLVLSEDAQFAMRFRMLETLREFGEEQLTQDERAVLQRQHAEHYLWAAGRHWGELFEGGRYIGMRLESPTCVWSREVDAHFRWSLDEELDNVRAAFAWSLERESNAQTALCLAYVTARFMEVRGYWRESLSLLESALGQGSSATAQSRLWCSGRAAHVAELLGDWKRAAALWETTIDYGREARAAVGFIHAADGLKLTAPWGDHERASLLLDEALQVARETGNHGETADALQSKGYLALWQENYPAARALFEESLRIAQNDLRFGGQPNPWGITCALKALGVEAARRGDYATARAYGEKVAEINRTRGLLFLVKLARDFGDYAAARALTEEFLAICQQEGNKKVATELLGTLGRLAFLEADTATARLRLEESIAGFEEIGGMGFIPGLQALLAEVVLHQGDAPTARALCQASLPQLRASDDRPGIAQCLGVLGRAALSEQDFLGARTLLLESLALRRDSRDKRLIADGLEMLAAVDAETERFEAAARLLGAAASLRQLIAGPRAPVYEPDYDALQNALRTALGENAFAAAWEAGRAMTWEQAVAYGLDEDTA